MQVAWLTCSQDSGFSPVIDLDGYRLSCYCKSHNGFITQRGMEYKMEVASKHQGLTGQPRGVRVVETVSVSGSTPTPTPASSNEDQRVADPPHVPEGA